ncbi:sugar phosphate isomerase/epimerase family protein [Planctomycetota bacterium]
MKRDSDRIFEFGISSWSYPWAIGVAKGPQPDQPLSALGLLEKAKALNVPIVQIADNLPLEKLSAEEIQALASFAKDQGIRIEVGTKGIEPDHMLRFLDLAQILGSPIVRTLPALFGVRVPIEEVEKSLCQVLDAYQAAGVVIVLENQEAYRADEYADIMARVNHPHLRICLDLSNALGAMEGPAHAMERMGPYCGNLHFKDVVIIRSKTLMGFAVEGRPSGQGSIPIHWMLDQVQGYGHCPSVIVELWPPFQETLAETIVMEEDWVRQSVEFMRTLDWRR